MNFIQYQIISLLLIILCSCAVGETYIKHENLINYNYSFLKEDSEEMTSYFENRDSFITNYTSAKYNKDTLLVTTFIDLNPCITYKGNIRFSNDTLYLLQQEFGEYSCSSTEFYAFEYIIVKEGIEKYHIVY